MRPNQATQEAGPVRVSYDFSLRQGVLWYLKSIELVACIKLGLTLRGTWIFSKGHWTDVLDIGMLKSHLSMIHITRLCSKLWELHPWSMWSGECPLSIKSYLLPETLRTLLYLKYSSMFYPIIC